MRDRQVAACSFIWFRREGGGELEAANGIDAGFEGRNEVETPGAVGEFMDELRFGGSGRLVFVAEVAAVLSVSFLVFGGQDHGTGGESVLAGVL